MRNIIIILILICFLETNRGCEIILKGVRLNEKI